MAPTTSPTRLRPALDELYRGFDHVHSATDPVHIVRRFSDPRDIEVVGFCAAGLAFGRVASVLHSIEALLTVLGPSPAAYVRQFDARRERAAFEPLVHRWIRGRDLVALVLVLQRMLRESGSVEAFFAEGDDPGEPDVRAAVESFSMRAMHVDLRDAYGATVPARAGVGYFFPRPSKGSACKRLNLFLRWMVRHDAIDLGIWRSPDPSRLVIPLDTHVVRVGRCLRLTRRVSPGWSMASDVTAALRQVDSTDPVRYDFSLCHLGMMQACGFGRAQRDSQCPLRGVCKPTVPRPKRPRD